MVRERIPSCGKKPETRLTSFLFHINGEEDRAPPPKPLVCGQGAMCSASTLSLENINISQPSWSMWMISWLQVPQMSYNPYSKNCYMHGRAATRISWEESLEMLIPCDFLDWSLKLGRGRARGQNRFLTSDMLWHMRRKHVLNIRHFKQDKIHSSTRLVGVLLWISLRTRPDIVWAVARCTRSGTVPRMRADH